MRAKNAGRPVIYSGVILAVFFWAAFPLMITAPPASGGDDPAAPKAAAHASGKLTPPARPLRAVQVMEFECATWDEVDKRLDEFKAAGVQAVILRVFHNQDDGYYRMINPAAPAGVYFQTSAAPVVADVLGPVIQMAHKKGLWVIAWMTTRYADYGHERESALPCMAWDFGKKAAVPARGQSPLLPEVQDRVAAIFADLARYPIDGVLLQDDLVLRHTEDMGPRARELYKKATGRDADPALFYRNVHKTAGGKYAVGGYTDAFYEWKRWQNRELLRFAERLRRTVQALRPHVPVGMNLHYEALTDPDHALPWYAQSLDATLDSDLDFYSLMLYHRQMQKELHLSRKAVFDLIDGALTSLLSRVDFPQRVWVKAQSVDWDTGARIPAAELTELLIRARGHGPVGLVVIPAKKSLDLAALKGIYQ
ncbi:MAG TPA: poly-beta-1,6-N-acetyl-D-glucosamine N-deacetylase PgaB [bacterium]|nr:poly-beta-1,6-N-acetyl-D-glucosamine N-deacetylase PgaB [bacterium]